MDIDHCNGSNGDSMSGRSCFKFDVSQSDYKRAGSPCLDAFPNELVGANDNVLQALGKFNDRLSQGGAVIDEDI